jgi:Lysylphosphatidylglycerol synthase TM region
VRAAHAGSTLSYPRAFAACLGALAVGSVSPVRGGELVRVALARPYVERSTAGTLAATLAVESIIDSALAVLLVSGSLLGGLVPGLDGLAALALPLRRLGTVRAHLRHGVSVLGDRRALARDVVSWLTLSWTLRLASVYWFLEAFSIEGTLALAVVVVAAQGVSTLVPVTWLGAGAQQGVVVFTLSAAAGPAQAVAFSPGTQAATLLVNLAAGSLALLARSFRLRSLSAALRLRYGKPGEVSEMA